MKATGRMARFAALVAFSAAFWSSPASAWFFFWIPTGAIARAMEKDPDEIQVTLSDRSVGKCAGYHVNQYNKFAPPRGSPEEPGVIAPPQDSPVAAFHKDMADRAVAKATDKQAVADLAAAYSTRWSRVAGADISANRTYGANLAQGCVENDLPYSYANLGTWRTNQEEKKRRQSEEAQRAAEEQRNREREQAAKRVQEREEATRAVRATNQIDFTAEARKSARILGCVSTDLRVTGTDGNNILFAATCDGGDQVALTCDPSGLCLKQ